MSSYKVEYSYDGNHWIAYVDSTKNNTSRGYRVSGFVSVKQTFCQARLLMSVIFIVESKRPCFQSVVNRRFA